MELFGLYDDYLLNGKALPTATSPGGVGIVKEEPLSVKPPGKFQGGVAEVQEASQVGNHPDAIVFKDLIVGLGFVAPMVNIFKIPSIPVMVITPPNTTPPWREFLSSETRKTPKVPASMIRPTADSIAGKTAPQLIPKTR